MSLVLATALALAGAVHYSIECANGTIGFDSDAAIVGPSTFVPQAGSLLYGDAVDLVTVDPTAPFGVLVQATTHEGTRLTWIFPDRRLDRRQKTTFGLEATLTVGSLTKRPVALAAAVDVEAAVSFGPKADYLPYVVGTVAVGVLAYELTRPAPHSSPVPEPASLACLGVGVIGLRRRHRRRR